MSLNNVTLMGRLTHEPELKQTPSGIYTTQFTVAVERDYADKNGERQTDFISCVAWRTTAEFISKYFSKGSMIAVWEICGADHMTTNGIPMSSIMLPRCTLTRFLLPERKRSLTLTAHSNRHTRRLSSMHSLRRIIFPTLNR